MESNTINTVIWDLDNTIWDWMGYAVPAYEAMCNEIAKIAGKSPDETANAMKAFYAKSGTIEDVGLVQGLVAADFFDGVEGFDKDKVILQVQRVFSKVRRENLHVYPGIAAVMEEINKRGLRQIAVTDAPKEQAEARLRRSGLSSFFEHVHTMPSPKVEGIPSELQRRFDDPNAPNHSILTEEKPHTDLERILDMTRERIAKEVAIIGDNTSKDMALAQNFGCLGIHAEYGVSNPDLIARIQRFAPPRVANRNMQAANQDVEVNAKKSFVSARKPEDILEILFGKKAA